jgi:ABC-type transporter Mla subunit MlaD
MSQQTGSGPQATQQNNSSTATMLSLDPTALEAMTSFNKTFGDYVNQLAGISIPNQVTISGNYTVDLKISGAAAIEALDKKIKEIGETLVTSTDFTTALNELRDETSRATKNAVKSSASRGSVSSSSEG